MAFDEQGQADTFERKIAICKRAYRLLVDARRLPARGHHLRPEHLRDRHRHRGAQQLRGRLHRGHALDPRATCRTPRSAAACPTCRSPSAATTPCARRSTPCSCTTRSRPGMTMGIVNAGQLGVYEDIEPELRERVEDVVLNRRPDAGERLVSFAEQVKAGGRKKEEDLAWRADPVEQAARARAGPRHHAVHRRRHRGVPGRDRGARRPPDRGHRRPADGRHEHRRRPVRRGQDVPAAGGEVGARDEAGGGAPDPVHRGREGGARGRRRRGTRQGQDRHRDRQGRRARHRQEHRVGRAPVQQLRSRQHGRDGAGREDPGDGARREGRHDRPVRPDHAVARGDGARGARDAAAGLQHPAADRRRDHQPRPHRGEDRAELLARPGGVRARRDPLGRRLPEPGVRRRRARASSRS